MDYQLTQLHEQADAVIVDFEPIEFGLNSFKQLLSFCSAVLMVADDALQQV